MIRLLSFLCIPLLCASLSAQEYATPSQVLASINLDGCSGTIFTASDDIEHGSAALLTCKHCADQIGQAYNIEYADGSKAGARLVAIEPHDDLALLKVFAKTVLATAPLSAQEPTGVKVYESCGYPHRIKRPYWQTLRISNPPLGDNGRGSSKRWVFWAKDGVYPGHSGSGVFADGQLYGVESDSWTANGFPNGLMCCRHDRIVAFVQKNADKLKDCGPIFDCVYRDESRNPAIVRAAPFGLAGKPGKNRSDIGTVLTQAPPAPLVGDESAPPPDFSDRQYPGHAKAPDAKGKKQAKIKIPDEFCGGRDQGLKLMEHEDAISQLQQRLAEVEKRQPIKGEKGEPGVPGEHGKDGKDFTPELNPIEKPQVNSPLIIAGLVLLTVLVSFGVFVFVLLGVLLAGKLLRFVGALFGK